MKKSHKHTDLSNRVCFEEGCDKHIKQRLVDLKDAKYCYKHGKTTNKYTVNVRATVQDWYGPDTWTIEVFHPLPSWLVGYPVGEGKTQRSAVSDFVGRASRESGVPVKANIVKVEDFRGRK